MTPTANPLKTMTTAAEPKAGRPLARRQLFAGAGVASALAATAVLLPTRQPAPAVPDAAARPADENSTGYRLTAHVQRYYQTAKV